MTQKKLLFLTMLQFVVLVYFLLTTIFFFMALNQGKEGIEVDFFVGGDGFFYWEQAQNVAEGNQWVKTSIYPLIIGMLIKITGTESVYLIRIFNFIGFVILVLLSLRLLKIQFRYDEYRIDQDYIYQSKVLLLLLFLLYTSLQINVNLSILRDVWIYLFYVLSTYLSIKVIYYKQNRLLNFMFLVASLWCLGEFRGYALLSFLLALFIYFSYTKIRLLRNSKMFVMFVTLGFILYYTFFIDFTVANLSLRKALNYRASNLSLYSGGSQMWISLDQSNILFFILNYAHSYIGNLIGPLPWHISGMSTLFIFIVETIPMIFILRYLWNKRKLLSSMQNYILLHAFVWISLIGFTNDNIGTASRLRPIAWTLILIVFVVLYIKDKFKKSITRKEVAR